MVNIFDVFLPQLLLYPNPTDPLNGEAATLLLKDSEKYKEKVKEYVKKFASLKDGVVKKDENEEENINEISDEAFSELSNASVEDGSNDNGEEKD